IASSKNNVSDISRREMIKTLGLGLGFTALPSFMASGMTEISIDALDHGERIIPVEEKDLIEMQKFIEDCIAANKESDPRKAFKEFLAKVESTPLAVLKEFAIPMGA